MATILQEGLPQAKSRNGNFDDEGARFSHSKSDQDCTRFDPRNLATGLLIRSRLRTASNTLSQLPNLLERARLRRERLNRKGKYPGLQVTVHSSRRRVSSQEIRNWRKPPPVCQVNSRRSLR